MKRFFKELFDERKTKEIERRTAEANERFNVVSIDGVFHIAYNGVIVTRGTDNDILERLQELRQTYING